MTDALTRAQPGSLTVLHRRGDHVWGTLDPTSGECVLRSGAPAAGDADIIDDLCEIVLQHGGDVVELAPDRMPSGTSVGAVVTAPIALAPRRREVAGQTVRP